ncbi:hypothetical protein [Moraxella marmotae]|uniref:hypothetical protein n=1 Tax=Moraxella marmotae TaxID=3344520 RepID=UPI0035F25D5B
MSNPNPANTSLDINIQGLVNAIAVLEKIMEVAPHYQMMIDDWFKKGDAKSIDLIDKKLMTFHNCVAVRSLDAGDFLGSYSDGLAGILYGMDNIKADDIILSPIAQQILSIHQNIQDNENSWFYRFECIQKLLKINTAQAKLLAYIEFMNAFKVFYSNVWYYKQELEQVIETLANPS